jgi:putative oxidoreductase
MRGSSQADLALLVSRFFIALLFLAGAAQKIQSPSDTVALLTAQNLSPTLVWPALVFNAFAGLMVLLGIGVRYAAIMLATYCGATSFFHWIPQDPWQISIFVKNWAIAGGCLALAIAGSGRLAFRPDKGLV